MTPDILAVDTAPTAANAFTAGFTMAREACTSRSLPPPPEAAVALVRKASVSADDPSPHGVATAILAAHAIDLLYRYGSGDRDLDVLLYGGIAFPAAGEMSALAEGASVQRCLARALEDAARGDDWQRSVLELVAGKTAAAVPNAVPSARSSRPATDTGGPEWLDRLDEKLVEVCSQDPDELRQPMLAMLSSGGKRLRPRLVRAAADCGPLSDPEQVLALATAVELLHNLSLVHDDMVDDSPLRRGRTSTHAEWGHSRAIQVAGYYYARVLALLADIGCPPAARVVTTAICDVAQGELEETRSRRSREAGVDGYYRVIGLKTAALFAGPCQAGAAVAGADLETQRLLYSFGWELGLAFQIVDDVIDFRPSTSGKVLAQDFTAGVPSLPMLYAMDSDAAGIGELRRAFVGEVVITRERAAEIVQATGAFDRATAAAEGHVQRAMTILQDERLAGGRSELMAMLVEAVLRDR